MNDIKYRKVKKYLSILKENCTTGHAPINELLYCESGYKSGNTLPPLSSMRPFYTERDLWGETNDSHAWFYTHISLPDNGRTDTELGVETELSGWDAGNPQFLVYVNGEMRQGLDTNHRSVTLGHERDYDVYLYAYTGQEHSKCRLRICTFSFNTDVRDLYYDIEVPFRALDSIPDGSTEYVRILDHLDTAVSMLYLLNVPSEKFISSVREARRYMQKEFYGKLCRGSEISVVGTGHTHIDCAWLWTLKQTREKVQRTFSTVVELMKKYPEYRFMSSQALLLKYLKKEAPEKYSEVKELVKDGKFDIEGAMWVEADCNLISGESLVRQILYGKRFFRDEFGVENHILWLPDVFGYSAALPQILRKSNVDWFVTSKISWNDTNQMPYDLFMWKGIDGSEIKTYFLTAQDKRKDNSTERGATYVGDTRPQMVAGTWNRFQQKSFTDEALLTFGFGDGGGGPTYEMLETAKRVSKGIPGIPELKIDTPTRFFNRLDKKLRGKEEALPKWQGELYLEYHRGTYTSIAKNKKNNRRSELLYMDTEFVSTLAKHLTSSEYPKDKLAEGWKKILTNQFHDIIPGSSIKEVYDCSDEDYREIERIASECRDAAVSRIRDAVDADSGYIVFNPHSFPGNGVVRIGGRTVYVTDIPAKGYRVIKDVMYSKNHIKISGRKAENAYFLIEFDKDRNIKRIFDKKAGREILRAGSIGNELQIYEDRPDNYDAWEISGYYSHKHYTILDVSSVKVIDDGVRKGVETIRKYMNSQIKQTIWLYENTGRIDFETELDWHERHQLLKAAFPVDINSDKATYEIQFGTVERPAHMNTSWDEAKFEVCAHKFADYSECGYGIALMNDCKYGYDIHNGVMKLTLVKCATYPNPEADQGHHSFTYSLYPHTEPLGESEVAKEATLLNYPMYALPVSNDVSGAKIPSSYSLINSDCENIIIDTVKESEDGEDTIVRLYENSNRRTKVNINIGFDFSKAYICDLEENELTELVTEGRSLSLTVKPFEIITLKFTV